MAGSSHDTPKRPARFPRYRTRIFNRPGGTFTADTPELPGVRGRSFAFRDWYQGVSAQWQPYISKVYKRAAEPQYNVIAVAVPIKAEDQKVLGILVMQIRLETLFDWSRQIEVGPSGFVYFVDSRGHVAAHPKFPVQGDIVDFSSVPVIVKVLRGERGVEITYNPVENEERLSAYEPVPGYGWGVVGAQPTFAAFAARRQQLTEIVLVYSFVVLLQAMLLWLAMASMRRARQAEAKTRQEKAKAETLLESIAKLAGKLIEVSAIGQGTLIPKVEAVKLTVLFDAIAAETGEKARARKIKITFPSVSMTAAIETDLRLLKACLLEVFENAIIYNKPEKGEVTINLRMQDGGILIEIQDTGLGITEDEQALIFTKFFRGSDRPPSSVGAGLGLFIAKSYVNLLKGKIWFKSEEGKGTTFSIFVPDLSDQSGK